ncbi:MAG: PIG-L deacetylase family protein [Acidobacteriota bacterium]
MKYLEFVVIVSLLHSIASAQPEVPVNQWRDKTIMLIGAHSDDDFRSHGTLAMLQANGNEIYIVTLTTGNVGTQDPDLSRFELAQIRRNEEIAALAELGIPADHYINLGYDDGLLEFADRLEVVGKLVREIRRIRPDVLFAFDPGPNYQRWHKTDHRAAAYLAADATRAAMWRLLFEGQIIQEGLKAYQIPEFMFYDSPEEAVNTWVDITDFAQKKVRSGMKYVSQWGPGWEDYKGPNLSEQEAKDMEERIRRRLNRREGKVVESFRYYKGMPDSMGRD